MEGRAKSVNLPLKEGGKEGRTEKGGGGEEGKGQEVLRSILTLDGKPVFEQEGLYLCL